MFVVCRAHTHTDCGAERPSCQFGCDSTPSENNQRRRRNLTDDNDAATTTTQRMQRTATLTAAGDYRHRPNGGFYAVAALIGVLLVLGLVCAAIYSNWLMMARWRSMRRADDNAGADDGGEKAFLAGQTYAVVPPKMADGSGGAYFYPTVALKEVARTVDMV